MKMRKGRTIGKNGARGLIIAALLGNTLLSVAVRAGELEDLNAQNAILQAQLVSEQTKNSLAALELARQKQASIDSKDIAANESAEAASKADREFAELAAITKAAGAKGSPEGLDGSVTIANDTTGILLEARSQGAEAVRFVAKQLCDSLQTNNDARNILPVPATAFASISRAKMRHAQLEAVLVPIDKRLGEIGYTPMSLTPEVLAFAKSAEVLYGSATTVAKFFKSDRDIKFGESTRTALFEGELGNSEECRKVFSTPMLQFQAARSGKNQVDALAEKLARLEQFRTATALARASFNANKAELKSDLAQAEKAKDQRAIDAANKALDDINEAELTLIGDEVLATRAGALETGFSDKADVTISDLAWLEMDRLISTSPVMTYVLSVQDVQEIKKRWWGTKVKYRTSVELVYQVVGSSGNVIAAGGIPHTSKGGTL